MTKVINHSSKGKVLQMTASGPGCSTWPALGKCCFMLSIHGLIKFLMVIVT